VRSANAADAPASAARIDAISTSVHWRGFIMFDGFRQDVGYALRTLAHAPLFTLTAIASLAIGIAGNATIFSLADAVLLRPLPGIAEPGRLVQIGRTQSGSGFDNMSYPNYTDLRARSTVFESLAAFRPEADALGLGVGDGARRVHGAFVGDSYFRVLGVPLALGRGFSADEDRPGGPAHVAVLSDRLWRDVFAGAPGVVGREIRVNGQPVTVIGVAAGGFTGHTVSRADLWLPLTLHPSLTGRTAGQGFPDMLADRRASWFVAIARLRDGVTRAQADAQVRAIGVDLQREFPDENRDERGLAVGPYRPVPGSAATAAGVFLGILLALVGLILLIACANLGGMMLARGAGEARDVAVRLALGAGRIRIVRQLVAESTLLAAAGGVAGVAAAFALVPLLQSLVPALPLSSVVVEFRVDWRVIGFSAALALLAGTFSGLLPALQASRTDLLHTMKADANEGVRPQRLRRWFVGAQVAVSVLLVVCALLLGRSLRHADDIDPGFDPSGVDIAEVNLTDGGYAARDAALAVSERLLASVASAPGVEAAASSIVVPLTGSGNVFGTLRRGDRPDDPRSLLRGVDWNVISPAYFDVLRIPLVRGRGFDARDREGAGDVAIVNETLARAAWPDEDPIGRTLVQGLGPAERTLQVVGIARDSKYRSLGEDPRPFIYVPMAQQFQARQYVMVRRAAESAVPRLRSALQDIAPNIPIVQASTLADAAALGLLPSQLAAAVATSVGAVGLLLSALGIYGIVAYTVARRRREIGVRMALGATAHAIVRLIGAQVLRVAGTGAVVGLLLAAAAAQVLRILLYGIAPLDPLSFGGAALLLALVALAAAALPARRAVAVDPAAALRAE
jgi:predicted permease